MTARPAGTGLADAVIDAVVEQYTDPARPARDALVLIMTNPALRAAYVAAAATIEEPLVDAIVERSDGIDGLTARVLAAGVAAAVRVALQHWLSSTSSGLVVPSGSLPTLLRTALTPLRAALDVANAAVPDGPGRARRVRRPRGAAPHTLRR